MEENIQEKHKSHRGNREKIKKKRKQEKANKKSKKIKKKEYEASKPEKKDHKKKHHNNKKSIKIDKLNKTIPKFLKVFQEDLDSFYDIFTSLDNGETVNISGLENVKIQKYLKKIFKYLRLKKNEEDYSKDPNIHVFKLRSKMKELVENSFFQETSSSSSNEEEDELEANPEIKFPTINLPELPSDKPKESAIKTKIPSIDDELNDNPENKDKTLNKEKKFYGVQFISLEEKEEFLKVSLSEDNNDEVKDAKQPIQREDWLKDDNLKNIIDSSFGKLKKERPKNQMLEKRVPKYLQDLFDKEPQKLKSVIDKKNEEEDEKEQEEMKEYMKQYDEMNNRGKSLLEMHKEKLKEKLKKKGGIPDRKPFNRDTDLQIVRHDSKKIFALVNEGDNSLVNRFKNSKWQKSFL